VQTFLPYASFGRSARVLDTQRLGKQRVEALQILRALIRPTYGWKHHPAVLMWSGYEEALVSYSVAVCGEWRNRGHSDTCLEQIIAESGIAAPRAQHALKAAGRLPPWLGQRAFHRAHQSALVRKNPSWYRIHFPNVPDDIPYVWPARPRPDEQRSAS
jgi:hypothetical protein